MPEKEFYTLEINGLSRKLPIITVNDQLKIASLVILGDTELVCSAANSLCAKLPEVDYLITAEAKGIPLIFEMSRILNMPVYFVARKSVKVYMQDPIKTDVSSITTHGQQSLYLDRYDAALIKGKRIAIVDDVISTGQSLQAVEDLVRQAGGRVVAKAAILAEGSAVNRNDIVFLKELPLFS